MNIDSILTEWRYRLPAGYPKTADDFGILRDVILEMTDVDLTEAERIVRRAMGLDEAPKDEDPEQERTSSGFSNSIEFEDYILSKYAVPGQEIIGLQPMYDSIIKNTESAELIELITGNSVLNLKTGSYPIRGVHGTLYDIIENIIKYQTEINLSYGLQFHLKAKFPEL